MSASDNLSSAQWHQTDMFKTAKELYGHELNDVEVENDRLRNYEGIDPEEQDIDVKGYVMDRKLAESKEGGMYGMYNHIKKRGVIEPVSLGEGRWGVYRRGVVSDGHHRIAAAYDIDPNMLVPVEHQE